MVDHVCVYLATMSSESGGVDTGSEREEVVVDLPQEQLTEGETPTNIDDVIVEGVSSHELVEVMT